MDVNRFFKGGLKDALEHAVKNTIQPVITGVLEIPELLGIEDAEDKVESLSDVTEIEKDDDNHIETDSIENGKNPSN